VQVPVRTRSALTYLCPSRAPPKQTQMTYLRSACSIRQRRTPVARLAVNNQTGGRSRDATRPRLRPRVPAAVNIACSCTGWSGVLERTVSCDACRPARASARVGSGWSRRHVIGRTWADSSLAPSSPPTLRTFERRREELEVPAAELPVWPRSSEPARWEGRRGSEGVRLPVGRMRR
jgi:hypothetical protein